jgi:hypothetical protein
MSVNVDGFSSQRDVFGEMSGDVGLATVMGSGSSFAPMREVVADIDCHLSPYWLHP